MAWPEAVLSMRTAVEWLKGMGRVKVLGAEVDPVLEMNAIMKALDEGPGFLAEKVKGYPHARMIGNLYSSRQNMSLLLGVKDYKETKFKVLEAIKNPLPPKVVKEAPCQEIFIPREEVDPYALFPMVKHTEMDGGRFFGSGVHYIGGKYAGGGSQLALYRMSFRGKDYASINMIPGGHGDLIAETFSKEKIPCTVNICPPPAVEITGMGSLNAVVFPRGIDEIGIAGALQGSPIEIVRAKTVDAYAIANSEWVIEGYIVPYERVWETEEAEKIGRQGATPFHPEWARYLGRAYRGRKFEVTAVTRRKDKPMYFVPFFGSPWGVVPFIEASWWEMADRLAPGFVVDVHNFWGISAWSGIVFQVKKRKRSDEGMQRNLLAAALGIGRGLRIAIVVDEDINIYSPEDLFFAITTRVNPDTNIIRGGAIGGRGQAYQPSERMAAGEGRQVSVFEGGLGIDATVPMAAREQFTRPRYAVSKIDLRKWLSEEDIKAIRGEQSEYFRYLGETGFP